MKKDDDRSAPIGIIDSGVGGLSFLREAQEKLPNENWVYYGDQNHAPYGKKHEAEIRSLVKEGIDWLTRERDVKAVVLACNTATAAAIDEARENYPTLILIGMEPEIKTALWETQDDELVLMLATEATCGSERYKKLKQDLDERGRMVEVPSPELVAMVEEGAEKREYEKILEKLIEKYRKEGVGAIVLGCSHFIFVREIIEDYIEEKWGRRVRFYGGVDGTVRRLKSRLRRVGLLKLDERAGQVELWTTGEREKYLPVMEKLLEQKGERK